jgi:competence protein ComEA
MKLILALVSFLMLSLGTASFAAETISKDVSAKTEAVVPKSVVNVNTADIAELTKLKGIGEKKAEAIIAWRKENGNFKSVDDLLEVKGIGEATLEANRENIQI